MKAEKDNGYVMEPRRLVKPTPIHFLLRAAAVVTAVFLKHIQRRSKEIMVVGTSNLAMATPEPIYGIIVYAEGINRVRSPIEAPAGRHSNERLPVKQDG